MYFGSKYFRKDHDPGLPRKIWSRLAGLARPHLAWIISGLLLSLVVTSASLLLPYVMRQAIDSFIINIKPAFHERIDGINSLAGWFLIIMGGGAVANFGQIVILEWAGQNMMDSLRRQLFAHTLTLPVTFFDQNPVGRITTRITNDIQNMYEMFTSVVVTGVNDLIRFSAILLLLFLFNWRLALAVSLVVPLLFIAIFSFGRLARRVSRKIRSRLSSINSFIQEHVGAISALQLFNGEQRAYDKFKMLGNNYYQAVMAQINLFGFFMPLIQLLQSTAIAIIIWYGGGEVIKSRLSLGDLTVFISYIRLFFQPARELSQKYSIIQSAMASAERIFQLLDTKPAENSGEEPQTFSGKIEFSHVFFSYQAGQPVLKDLSFTVHSGETVAIVGATGAGKSTIINLIERFYEPDSGSITLDGRQLSEISAAWLRNRISLVPQDIFIIPGSIKDNIILDLEISNERLREILHLSRMDKVVADLPKGIDTELGKGLELSRGQKQLLSIARVMARDPQILILDEATANIDSATEMLVEQALNRLMKGRTCILVAHRYSTIRRADNTIVIKK
jgi:ATP-binding cassette subfamily B protein